ncbi:uncharacterized protein LAESUDRAFT_167814 [Laetiporus sulphureus 93-53]|uniref:Zn(2)-C6 fungal-type domain-containing protein n=1 Tax=Laetiporus sulphureus 93-53 TaxID=1314785 RepID=A0A165HSS8_9APHY|nr:uncharacterized protein LAESUDRAFT_167814 [Laetiporus sulphureus 93-53]KZT12137.1 hypothetical protein LAESUDRAFT_167814 [Laetiporus sulphureus 93-53]
MNPAVIPQASSPQREDMVTGMEQSLSPDVDHRRRPRNRPTQSCFNCHTSKRKCDRKRPCSRCIQLGLTGLCVYEIDDPALRDDPNINEITRLRNRIAELESVLREMRGKPHPRWAETGYRGGDAHENRHSRTKSDNHYQSQDLAGIERFKATAPAQGSHRAAELSYISSMVKEEPGADSVQNYLYSLPGPSSKYPQRSHYPTDSTAYFHPSSGDSPETYAEYYRSGAHEDPDDEQSADFYGSPRISLDSEVPSSTCSCLTNPTFVRPLAAFMTHLHTTSQLLQHASGDHDQQECLVLAHMIELDAIIRSGNSSLAVEYAPSPASVERGVMSPVSTLSQESCSSISSDGWTPQSANHAYFHTYERVDYDSFL